LFLILINSPWPHGVGLFFIKGISPIVEQFAGSCQDKRFISGTFTMASIVDFKIAAESIDY